MPTHEKSLDARLPGQQFLDVRLDHRGASLDLLDARLKGLMGSLVVRELALAGP